MTTLAWLRLPARALVVGIDKYDAPDTLIPCLDGAVADAHAVYNFLVRDLGLAAGAVRLLTAPVTAESTKATRAAILDGIRSFLAAAPRGSEVLVYFAGHGSMVQVATEIAFRDVWVESLVPADARVGGVPDILDLEVYAMRADLARRGVNLTMVVDACHAGDVFRGGPVPVGTLVPRLIGPPHDAPRPLASLLGGTLRRDALLALYNAPDKAGQTLVATCLGTQQAYELRSQEGTYGLMTRAFLDGLRSVGAALSYTELARVLAALMPERYRGKQRPQITGDVARGVFGSPVAVRAAPCVVVAQVTAEGEIRLNGGRRIGLTPGSMLARYRDWLLEHPLESWEVTSARGDNACARALIPATASPVPGQPLVLVTPSELPTIWFYRSAHAVYDAWQDESAVGLSALAEIATADTADYRVRREGDAWVVRRRHGADDARLHLPCGVDGAAYELARRLNTVAGFDTFVQHAPLAAERWDVALNAPGGLILDAALAPWAGNEHPLHAHAPAPLSSGDRIRLTLTNNTGQDLWCAVYLLDEAAWVAERLFPGHHESDLYVPAGKTRSTHWYSYDWAGGVLSLKVIASRGEMIAADTPPFPLGKRDTLRGIFVLDGHSARADTPWSVWYLSLGMRLEPDTPALGPMP